MAVMDKETSSKIRAAIKAKLVEIGAYVDEELPDYVMVMVINKRSKAQMIEDLQLFLGKNTDQFTEWLQELLDKAQNTKTVSGEKPTRVESGQSSKEKQHTTQKSMVKKASPQTLTKNTANPVNSKTSSNVCKSAVTIPSKVSMPVVSAKPAPMSVVTVPAKALSKTNISMLNTDEDAIDFDDADLDEDCEDEYLEDYEDFINIKADAEAASSTSTPQNSKQRLRNFVSTPSSVVTVVTKRPADTEQHSGLAKKRRNFMLVNDKFLRTFQNNTEDIGRKTAVMRNRSNAFRVTDRLGVQQVKGVSVRDRLGVKTVSSINSAQAPSVLSRFAGRLGARNNNTEASSSNSGSNRDRLASRNSSRISSGMMERLGSKSVPSSALVSRAKVTERLGARKYNNKSENQEFPAKGTEHTGKKSSEVANSAVTVNKPSNDGRGSKLAQRLRELAESSGNISFGARVAHVPPNNIRQSNTSYVGRRPTVNSQIVSAASRVISSHKSGQQNNSEANDVSVEVAVPSVVRVTPRPRLPASMQANKNLLLRAVAEAQRSVAEAAVTAMPAVGAVLRRGSGQEPQAQPTADRSSSYQAGEGTENPEQLKGQFLLGFRKRENFAVTVSNQSNDAEEMDAPEMEGEFEFGEESAEQLQVTTSSSTTVATSRVVVTTTAECHEPPKPFIGTEKSQQITIQLSPEGSQEGDSSSEHDVVMHAPSETGMKDKRKSEAAEYDEPMIVDEEDQAGQEDEESAMSVAAVRPTVVTTIPHMDLEPLPHINPQFVVTLDGMDFSMFPHSSMDYDDSGIDQSTAVNRDGVKEESTGSGVSNSSVCTGRATIVHRVEPRLRLGPLPNHQQEEKNTGQSTDLNPNIGSSSSSTKTMERCKFWPVCRMGDKCNYHHPTQPCRAFPACKFGDKCLYVHPNCKFDASCTRRDCPYTHASPRLATSSAPQGNARTGNIQTVCRFFPNCSNPTCKFLHPKACKYGRYCVKPGCVFQHGAVPSTDKLKWVCPFRA